jgi:hypothetical protein
MLALEPQLPLLLVIVKIEAMVTLTSLIMAKKVE